MNTSIDTMSVRGAINGRCSVRAYAPDKVDGPTLHALLDAAVRAPTAMHGEPWQFVIIQSLDTLKRLSDRAKELFSVEAQHLHPGSHSLAMFSQPSFNVFYDAGTLVVICAKTSGRFEPADCWLAAENLMLAAYSMGLGSCVIGSAVAALNAADIKLELGIPPGTTAIAPVIIGKPVAQVSPATRHQPDIVAWL